MTNGTPHMTDQKAPAVEVRNLSKHYGEFVALKNVNLSIAAGEYFVLLGPSGGGKTTLLRTIGGFQKPTKGEILLHGRSVGHLPPDSSCGLRCANCVSPTCSSASSTFSAIFALGSPATFSP